jgi:hypothetical protein
MARCPDCNKFVSFEEEDPEVNLDVDEEGTVTGDVTINNNCGECGTALRTANFDVENDVAVEAFAAHVRAAKEKAKKKAKEGEKPEEIEHTLEVENNGSERTQRQDGKPGTPSRYRRTFYGFSVAFEVKCSCGNFNYEGTIADDVQGSGMDEC